MSNAKNKYIGIGLSFSILAILFYGNVSAIQVFPGAVGFGSDTRAAYADFKNPTIFIVDNLTNNNGTPRNSTRNGIPVKLGSFKEAINYNADNKFIIFEVSGTITVNGRLVVDNNNVTIAGQTAPPPGITLRGCTLQLCGHDILVQHIRVRVGDGSYIPDYTARDGININSFVDNHPFNVVVDHCSISWAMDENMGIGNQNYVESPILNATVSNCILSEPLQKYPESPNHTGKNLITGRGANNVSIINNIFAHSHDRNPFIAYGWSSLIVANNLIYNPGDFNIIIQLWEGPIEVSIVGNVVKGGRNTNSLAKYYMPTFWKDPWPGTKVYINDNRCDAGVQKDENDWSYVRENTSYTIETLESTFKASSPQVWPENFKALASEFVEGTLLTNSGAFPNARDDVDERIISDIIHRSGTFIISQYDVGGWPQLAENRLTHVLPQNPHSDDDNDGYTNLEEWVHQKAQSIEQTISSPQDLIIKK